MVSSQEKSTAQTGTTLRILFAVIENQKKSNVQVVQALAHETHYFVLVVNNYEQMLNIADDASPDLFLFDYASENSNGMAHYRQLRTHLAYRNTPVVMLNTPFSQQEPEDEMLKCLPQSVKYDALVFAINVLLTKRERMRTDMHVDWSVKQYG